MSALVEKKKRESKVCPYVSGKYLCSESEIFTGLHFRRIDPQIRLENIPSPPNETRCTLPCHWHLKLQLDCIQLWEDEALVAFQNGVEQVEKDNSFAATSKDEFNIQHQTNEQGERENTADHFDPSQMWVFEHSLNPPRPFPRNSLPLSHSKMNPLYTSINSIIDAIKQNLDPHEKHIHQAYNSLNALQQQFSERHPDSPLFKDTSSQHHELHQMGVQLWNVIQSSSILHADTMKSEHHFATCHIAIQLIDIGWKESPSIDSPPTLMKAIQILSMITEVAHAFLDEKMLQSDQLIQEIALRCKDKVVAELKSVATNSTELLTVRMKADASQCLFNFLVLNIEQLLEQHLHATEFSLLVHVGATTEEDWLFMLGLIHDACLKMMRQKEHNAVVQVVHPMLSMLHELQAQFPRTNDNTDAPLAASCFKLLSLYVAALIDLDQLEQAHQVALQLQNRYNTQLITEDKLFAYLLLKLRLRMLSSPQECEQQLIDDTIEWPNISSSAWIDIMLHMETVWRVHENEQNKHSLYRLWLHLIHHLPQDDNWVTVLHHFLRFCSFNSLQPELHEIMQVISPKDVSVLSIADIDKMYQRFMQLSRALFGQRQYQGCIEWSEEALRFACAARDKGAGHARTLIFDAYMQIARCQLCALDTSSREALDHLRRTSQQALEYVDSGSDNEELLLVSFISSCYAKDVTQINNIIKKWQTLHGYSADLLVSAGMFALKFENRDAAIQALETSLSAPSIDDNYVSKSAVLRCLLSLYRNRNEEDNTQRGSTDYNGTFPNEESVKRFVGVLNCSCEFPLIRHMDEPSLLWLCRVIWNGAVDMLNQKFYVHCFDALESLSMICNWRDDVADILPLKVDCCRLRAKAALCIYEEKLVPNHENYIPQTLKIIAQGREIDTQMHELHQRVSSEQLKKIQWAFGSLFALELRVRIASQDTPRNIGNLIRAAATHEYVNETHLAFMCATLENAHHLDNKQVEEWTMTIFNACIQRVHSVESGRSTENVQDLCTICISALNCAKRFTEVKMETMNAFLSVLERHSAELIRSQIEWIATKSYNNSARSYRLNFLRESAQWLGVVDRLVRLPVMKGWNGAQEANKLKGRLSL